MRGQVERTVSVDILDSDIGTSCNQLWDDACETELGSYEEGRVTIVCLKQNIVVNSLISNLRDLWSFINMHSKINSLISK